MGFFKNSSSRNYDFLSGFSWYVPGVSGIIFTSLWMLVGAIIGNGIGLLFGMAMGADVPLEYVTAVSYPFMFIVPMIAARLSSNRNMLFDDGYKIDSNNFGKLGVWILGLLCIIATIALSFCSDYFTTLLPPMPEYLEEALDSMTQGSFAINFLCVSIMAPICEEWLCRGIVLRGLLYFKHKNDDSKRGIVPWLAIVISALFFAVIHLNPWQAIPAFLLGLLFGYIYYKTGSLKLTMLMHFANNTFALVMSNIDKFKDVESFTEIMPKNVFVITFIAALLILTGILFIFKNIPLNNRQGNLDYLPAEENL